MILIKFESFFIREQKKEKNVKLKIDFNSNQLRRHGSLIIDCSYTLPMLIHSPVHFFLRSHYFGGKSYRLHYERTVNKVGTRITQNEMLNGSWGGVRWKTARACLKRTTCK